MTKTIDTTRLPEETAEDRAEEERDEHRYQEWARISDGCIESVRSHGGCVLDGNGVGEIQDAIEAAYDAGYAAGASPSAVDPDAPTEPMVTLGSLIDPEAKATRTLSDLILEAGADLTSDLRSKMAAWRSHSALDRETTRGMLLASGTKADLDAAFLLRVVADEAPSVVTVAHANAQARRAAEPTPRERAIADVVAKREHDDALRVAGDDSAPTVSEWAALLEGDAYRLGRCSPREGDARDLFVLIAATAIAAIESHDRKAAMATTETAQATDGGPSCAR